MAQDSLTGCNGATAIAITLNSLRGFSYISSAYNYCSLVPSRPSEKSFDGWVRDETKGHTRYIFGGAEPPKLDNKGG